MHPAPRTHFSRENKLGGPQVLDGDASEDGFKQRGGLFDWNSRRTSSPAAAARAAVPGSSDRPTTIRSGRWARTTLLDLSMSPSQRTPNDSAGAALKYPISADPSSGRSASRAAIPRKVAEAPRNSSFSGGSALLTTE